MVGAPEAVLYRNVARGQVDQRRGNEERADPPRTAGVQQNRRLLDRLEAADAGADHDAGPLLRLLVRRLPPRIFDRHARRADAVDDDAVDLALLADRKSTRLTSSHYCASRMPSSACKKHTHHSS